MSMDIEASVCIGNASAKARAALEKLLIFGREQRA